MESTCTTMYYERRTKQPDRKKVKWQMRLYLLLPGHRIVKPPSPPPSWISKFQTDERCTAAGSCRKPPNRTCLWRRKSFQLLIKWDHFWNKGFRHFRISPTFCSTNYSHCLRLPNWKYLKRMQSITSSVVAAELLKYRNKVEESLNCIWISVETPNNLHGYYYGFHLIFLKNGNNRSTLVQKKVRLWKIATI